MSKAALTPISKLTRSHGHVLILSASGIIDTPLSAAVGFRDAKGQVLTLDGTRLDTGANPSLGFMPLPWNDAEAEALILSGHTQPAPMRMDEAGLWHGASGLVFELAEAVGPNRAMDRLANFLGLRQDDFRLPANARRELHELRSVAMEWVADELPAEAAIEAARRIIDGSAPAEETAFISSAAQSGYSAWAEGQQS